MINISTINVKGLRDSEKRLAYFRYLKQCKYDIIFLQETHCTSTDVLFWSKQWSNNLPSFFTTYNEGAGASRGCAILFNTDKFKILSHVSDPQGRFVSVYCTYNSIFFDLLCVYAPNSGPERRVLFESLTTRDTAAHDATTHYMVAGDFNCITDPSLDKVGGDPDTAQMVLKILLGSPIAYSLLTCGDFNIPTLLPPRFLTPISTSAQGLIESICQTL